MEVTTVSPSPASPTEGDDLCETDVTNVAIHSVTLLISLCGLVGNGAVLCPLSLKLCNTVIYRLALADFIFMVFTVISTLLFLVEDVSCSLIMPLLYLRFLFSLSVASCYWALFWLMLRSNIVCMDKLWKLCCHCDLSKRWLCLAVYVQFLVFSVVFTAIHVVTYQCPSHQQEQCRAALISVSGFILLLLVAPVAISSTINFIKATRGSKKLKPKRHSIVVFLIVLFILLLIICNFLHLLGYTVMSSDVLFLLNCFQSSIKPFICCLAGGCQRPCSLRSLRLSLQRVFEEQEEETAHNNDTPMETGV